jgi:hypothetical protein
MEKKLEIVLCERPLMQGLTIIEILQILINLGEPAKNQYQLRVLPLEFYSPDGQSHATGFITEHAAEVFGYDWNACGLADLVRTKLFDTDSATDGDQFSGTIGNVPYMFLR